MVITMERGQSKALRPESHGMTTAIRIQAQVKFLQVLSQKLEIQWEVGEKKSDYLNTGTSLQKILLCQLLITTQSSESESFSCWKLCNC